MTKNLQGAQGNADVQHAVVYHLQQGTGSHAAVEVIRAYIAVSGRIFYVIVDGNDEDAAFCQMADFCVDTLVIDRHENDCLYFA